MIGIKDFGMINCCTNSSFVHCPFYDICVHRETIRANFKPNDCPLIEAIPKSEYENRLKADLKAILVELQLEIKELWDNRYDVWLDNQYYIGKSDTLEEVDEVIQQKIDKLKENIHGDD